MKYCLPRAKKKLKCDYFSTLKYHGKLSDGRPDTSRPMERCFSFAHIYMMECSNQPDFFVCLFVLVFKIMEKRKFLVK